MLAILNDRTGPIGIIYKPLWWETANNNTYCCYVGTNTCVLVARAVFACFMLEM